MPSSKSLIASMYITSQSFLKVLQVLVSSFNTSLKGNHVNNGWSHSFEVHIRIYMFSGLVGKYCDVIIKKWVVHL